MQSPYLLQLVGSDLLLDGRLSGPIRANRFAIRTRIANRREDVVRANLAKCFKNRFLFANRFARICETLVCESPAH